jgi:hypothetical protein
MAGAHRYRVHLALLLLLTTCSAQLSVAATMASTAVRQRQFSVDDLAAQVEAKASYFSSHLNQRVTAARAFAAVPVQLGGGYLSLGTFTVDVTVGAPGVTVPVIVDTGSELNFVQGPDCATCPGDAVCSSSPFGGASNCPFAGPNYDSAASSTAVTGLACTQCQADESFGSTGCLGKAFSAPNTCQFSIQYGSGNAAGQYIQNVVSVGLVSTGTSKIFFGTTVFETTFDGTAVLFGFGPTGTSLPFQLKQVGASLVSSCSCLPPQWSNDWKHKKA